MERLYRRLMGLFPADYIRVMRRKLRFADDQSGVHVWLGKSLLLSLAGAILISFLLWYTNVNSLIIGFTFIIVMVMGQFFTYLMAYFRVESRTARIEKDLPDALQLIASNLHAGMTPYRAIKLSSRKEFGPLSVELNKAVSKGLGVKNFSKELMAIGERTPSVVLNRTLKLITSSLTSGSHLAMLLEELSEDIADTQSLKNEMITNTKTYSMFIMFTIIAGAPLLLAISVHFVGMVQNMQESATLSTDEFGLGFLAGELTVTPEFLTSISFAVLAVTSMLATMFTGVITKGNMTSGLKYSPVIMSASMILFVIAKYLIGNFF